MHRQGAPTHSNKRKTMATVNIRAELAHFIEEADDRFVSALYAMVRDYVKGDKDIYIHTLNGTPLSKSEFVDMIESGREQAFSDGLSSDDVRKIARKEKGYENI